MPKCVNCGFVPPPNYDSGTCPECGCLIPGAVLNTMDLGVGGVLLERAAHEETFAKLKNAQQKIVDLELENDGLRMRIAFLENLCWENTGHRFDADGKCMYCRAKARSR